MHLFLLISHLYQRVFHFSGESLLYDVLYDHFPLSGFQRSFIDVLIFLCWDFLGLRIPITVIEFRSSEVKTSVSGVHFNSLDTIVVIGNVSWGRTDKSLGRVFDWILFLFCSYFIETVKKWFIASILVTELYFRKLRDGNNVRVGNECSFVFRLVPAWFLADVCFETMRKIVFLENHLLNVRFNFQCFFKCLRIGRALSLFLCIKACGLFEW